MFVRTKDYSYQNNTVVLDKEDIRRINNFFHSNLVAAVQELNTMIEKKFMAASHANNYRESQVEREFQTLTNALKNKTPLAKMTKEEASAKRDVQDIATAALELKEAIELELTGWQKAGRLIAKILDAIAIAAPGAILGAKLGIAAGAAAGGGILSIPAATVGGIAGAVIGGGAGFLLNYKYTFFAPFRRISHCISDKLTQADLTDTINKEISNPRAP